MKRSISQVPTTNRRPLSSPLSNNNQTIDNFITNSIPVKDNFLNNNTNMDDKQVRALKYYMQPLIKLECIEKNSRIG